ncbi:DUF6428 family protein [Tardiphaga sp. 709]|uniref:DUF6428 family protein n=1 Tax=Tardiphaga sp. 709 TaxID=3076039 RepID=UPI0028ECE515|nr:DUF6428 family protein [Tardiphaga sp. 709]WNV12645.1 DUF6428 family protein [Tardiphaga sp. 709]
MLDLAKPEIPPSPQITTDDISIGALLTACDAAPALPLVFTYGGHSIRPGYHVTEVKAGAFSALDCGGNPEAWSEIFVQLWDIVESDRTHMTAGKFAAIIRKVSDHVALDANARLTFEVSDGVAPMQLHCADTPRLEGDNLTVALAPRPASCKPRDRWLEAQNKASACCAPVSSKNTCCP